MNTRERVLAAISNREVDRIPMMYRGLPETNDLLCGYFGIDGVEDQSPMQDYDLNPDPVWMRLIGKLNTDLFSGGATIGAYTVLYPRYFGKFSRIPKEYAFGYGLEHVWGLIPEIVKARNHTYRAIVNHPLEGATSPDDIKRYKPPGMDEFDFSVMKVNERIKENAIYCVGSLNQIFMIASYLRGMDTLLLDMAAEPIMAETLINKVAEVAVELNRRSLQQIASQVDVYVLWDDVAMQDRLIMSPSCWERYLKKWYEKLFTDAKKYGLKIFYHCCGNVNSIIPSLIDMGVDVLDPVQTSALDMDLMNLRKRYGKNLSYHGGLDVQNLLPYGSIEDIKKAIKEARFIFGHDGGIILGPSHEITPDTPLENILAIYN